MVPGGDIIAAHQDEVVDAEGGRPEQVGLQRQPVAVPHGQLHDGLEPLLHQQVGCRQRRHMHMGAGVIGAIDGID